MCVVLVLSHPPAPWGITDWYWKEIAGVPFLLRNILNIQQAGARRLMLFADNNGERLDELCRRVKNDARVHLQLECHSKPEELVADTGQDSRLLFLDGSTLQNITRLAKIIQPASGESSPKTASNFFLCPNHLETLMQRIDNRGLLPWQRSILSQDIAQEISQNPGIHIKFMAKTDDFRIAQPEDFKTASDRLIKSCGLSNDSFMDRSVTRFISRQLTRQLIKTPLTPNQITFISCVVGLGAAACFLVGSYGMGVTSAGLLLLSTWIDCTDGEVARLKFLESSLGKQMDIVSDNLVHMAVFFSIGLGLSAETGNGLFIFLGGLAVLGCLVSFILISQEIVKNKMNCGESKPFQEQKKSIVDRLANRDFTYLLFFMVGIARLDVFLVLSVVGSNIFAGYLLYDKFKTAS